jgi:Fungal N-terminal domain of STAND proteins
MDPLSVSASVAGLLTAAQQISSLVGNVVASRRNGSKEINDIKSSLRTLRSILLQLQVLLLGQATVDRKRASMILVDEIIATLAACVMTFSDIHGCLKSIESDEQLALLDSVRWVTKREEMAGFLRALEAHKSSLSLVINILTWCPYLFLCQLKHDELMFNKSIYPQG